MYEKLLIIDLSCIFVLMELHEKFIISSFHYRKNIWPAFLVNLGFESCFDRLDLKQLHFDRLNPKGLGVDWFDWYKNEFECVQPKRAMLRLTRPRVVMFPPVSTGYVENAFDCFRPMLAIFWPTRPKLAMLWPTRPKERCVRLCLTQPCYVLNKSTQIGCFSTDSTKLKTCLIVFDQC